MKIDKKSKIFIYGLIVIINIILIILRFQTDNIDSVQGSALSTGIFFLILFLLTYFFFLKRYEFFIIVWLSFYFASPIIVLSFTQIGSLGILNAIFVPLMLYKTIDFKNKNFSKYFTIIAILLLISILHIANSDVRTIISMIFLFITPFMFFYFVLKKCEDLKLVMWSSIIITLINIPLGLYEILYQPSWGIEVDWRGFRIFGNLFWHNSYSLYLLPSILTLYAFYKKESKNIYLALMIILIILDIFTFSRTGLISLAISLFVFEFIYSTGLKITTKKVLAILLLMSSIIIYINVQDSLGSHLQPETISERTAIWDTITPYLKGNLVFGNGIGSYDIYRVNFLNELSSHNSYLNIVFEIGLLGLLLFLIFIFFIYKDLMKKIKLKTSLRASELGLALLVGVLCYSLLGNASFSQVVALNVWVILACCVKYEEANEDIIKTKRPRLENG